MKTKIILAAMAAFAMSACSSDADVASQNLSKAADNFKVSRRVVFYNSITGDHILSIEGLCSLKNENHIRQISITCKTDGGYKKHFLALSENVTYFIEQVDPYPFVCVKKSAACGGF